MSDQAQTLEQLLALNYAVKIRFDADDAVYVAEFLDLPGCAAYGTNVEEAYNNAQQAKREWLAVSLEQGLPIPKPPRIPEHGGRILLRVPSSLHSMLADRARIYGTSLNQYLVHLLSSAAAGDQITDQVDQLKTEVSGLRDMVAALSASLNVLTPRATPLGQFVTTSTWIPWSGADLVADQVASDEESDADLCMTYNPQYGTPNRLTLSRKHRLEIQ